MPPVPLHPIGRVIGRMPYRMAFAGGWIDQPFVSRLNPDTAGSMVTVMIEPEVRFMDRAGMATGTRQVALRLWKGRVPKGDPARRVRELYAEEKSVISPTLGLAGHDRPALPRDQPAGLRLPPRGRILPRPHRVPPRPENRPLAGKGRAHDPAGPPPAWLQPARRKAPRSQMGALLWPVGPGLLRRHPRPRHRRPRRRP
ncbi:MAG: hypothetical protein U1F87_03575 [Kiritimatiellia bacterium]